MSSLSRGTRINIIKMNNNNNKIIKISGNLIKIKIESNNIKETTIIIDNVINELSKKTMYTLMALNIKIFLGESHLETILQKSKNYCFELGIIKLISSFMYVNTIVKL